MLKLLFSHDASTHQIKVNIPFHTVPIFHVQLYPTVKTHFFIGFSTVKATFLGPSTVNGTCSSVSSLCSCFRAATALLAARSQGRRAQLSARTSSIVSRHGRRMAQRRGASYSVVCRGAPLNNHCNPILFARSSG